jgi:hypothetical protein
LRDGLTDEFELYDVYVNGYKIITIDGKSQGAENFQSARVGVSTRNFGSQVPGTVVERERFEEITLTRKASGVTSTVNFDADGFFHENANGRVVSGGDPAVAANDQNC